MKKYLLVISLFGFLFGQEYQILLDDNEKLKIAAGDNYDVIKTELNKMLADYNSKLDLDNFWKDKILERVYAGTSFDEDGYLSALLSMNNPSQADADYLKRSFTRDNYRNVEKAINREIEIGETLSSKSVEWSDIVTYFGGYSEISKIGFSKKDVSKFDIKVVLDKIELTGSSTCLAHVKIIGDEKYAFKFHKILKSAYEYEGTYKIDYDNDYSMLYYVGNIWINVKFDKKPHLPSFNKLIVLNKSILPSNKKYKDAIDLMFNDLIDPAKFLQLDPDYYILEEQYVEIYGLNLWFNAIENLSKSEIENDIIRGRQLQLEKKNEMEAKKAISDQNSIDSFVYSLQSCAYIIAIILYLTGNLPS